MPLAARWVCGHCCRIGSLASSKGIGLARACFDPKLQPHPTGRWSFVFAGACRPAAGGFSGTSNFAEENI